MSEHTVLAVDDNEDILDLVNEALSDHGLRVIRARSGADAMALLMSHQIDLVLLDLKMPDMNGFSVQEAILEMVWFIPRLANTSVIVHTAHAEDDNVARARELGAVAVLPKPISPDALLQEVRKHLAARKPARSPNVVL